MSQGPQGGGPVALEWPGDVRDLPAAGGAWWWLAALAVAALALAWWARRRQPQPVAIAVPPAEATPAPTAAALLRALSLPGDAASAGVFVAEVKRLVRLHARERFALAADVATSEELQRALPQAPGLAPCLSQCDRVLFAAAALRGDAAATVRAQALAFAGDGAPTEARP
jgi:hypothetical protein